MRLHFRLSNGDISRSIFVLGLFVCSYGNLKTAGECNDGFTGENCSERCPPTCKKCPRQSYIHSMKTCFVCIDGYYNGYHLDSSSSQERSDCTLKCHTNCKACTSYYNCDTCATGYFLNGNKRCNECSIFCEKCNSSNSCAYCRQGYYLNYNSCVRCDPNCKKCLADNRCTECNDMFYVENGSCIMCPENCASCDSEKMCNLCKKGYILTDGGCSNCRENCAKCHVNDATQENNCTECVEGYFLSHNTCFNCSRGCLLCSSKDMCQKCEQKYRLQDGICVICKQECLKCSSDNKCEQCRTGYYNEEGTCQPCRDKCIDCLSSDLCQTCKNGFFGASCSNECPANCRNNECRMSQGTCVSCADGYYFSGNNVCVQCPIHCTACLSNESCSECYQGYTGSSCQEECNACKQNSTCDKTSGYCHKGCKDGLSGYNCNISCNAQCLTCDRDNQNACKSCPLGMFDYNCLASCPSNCLSRACNITNGECTLSCVSGFWGSKCEKQCPEKCKDQACNRSNGTCTLGCKEIYTGPKCLCPRNCNCSENGTCLGCKEGFGDICENRCSDGCAKRLCNRTTGMCLEGCREGYNGSYCLQGIFGLDKDTLHSRMSDLGLVLGIACVFLTVLGFLVYKKKNSTCVTRVRELIASLSTRREDEESNMQTFYDSADDIEELNIDEDDYLEASITFQCPPTLEDDDKYYNTVALRKRKIPLQRLEEYVSEKSHEDFLREFMDLPSSPLKPFTESLKKENLKKNRYKGIYPYDSCLVTLNGATTEYINASYIDGYKKLRAYIATVGPSYQYMGDMYAFWKMVWDEKCERIVMLNNLDEQQAYKCDRYWPEKEYSCVFDRITVSLLGEEKLATYTLRTFEMQSGRETRCVTQFNFTTWQEKTLPDATSLAEFRQKVDNYKSSMNGIVVVHCSAGVGRTGTYIALDMLTKEAEAEGHVDIFACVRNLREQRVRMVQTVEQYKFLHQALIRSISLYTQVDERRQSRSHLYEECGVQQTAYTPLVFKKGNIYSVPEI